jgi:hypothetical protein
MPPRTHWSLIGLLEERCHSKYSQPAVVGHGVWEWGL